MGRGVISSAPRTHSTRMACRERCTDEMRALTLHYVDQVARQLSDEEFSGALKFVRASFEAALVFRAETVKATVSAKSSGK